MASIGKIVKIVREKDGKLTVMSTSAGRQEKKTLEEALEIVKTEYREEEK